MMAVQKAVQMDEMKVEWMVDETAVQLDLLSADWMGDL